MFEPHVVFLDLETTGASADRDRIAEIGLVEVADGQLVDEWSTLVNPGRPLPSVVTSLTGITDQMVSTAPNFADISSELQDRLEGRLIVAHNARFDYAFLRAEFRRLGIRFRSRVLCTVRLSRKLFPEHRQHNLDSVMERFSLSCSARHRALSDAQVLWAFARELRRTLDPERLAAAVSAVTRIPSLPAGMDHERFEDLPDTPGTYVFYGPDGAPLYVGKSLNLRSRLIAHFATDGDFDREQRIALQTASLEWTETAGELGAALREIALLRKLTPTFNRRRKPAEAWTLRWSPGGVVNLADIQSEADISAEMQYGVFRSRGDALAALRGIARAEQLCRIELGLESGPGPCSAQPHGDCRGVCAGQERPAQHMLRVAGALARLRLAPWPFTGRVAIHEADPFRALIEVHLLNQWRYLGSARTEPELEALLDDHDLPPFDIDQYRLLSRYLNDKRRPLNVVELDKPGARASIW
jgi:DNA polymerase III subunit epsilon